MTNRTTYTSTLLAFFGAFVYLDFEGQKIAFLVSSADTRHARRHVQRPFSHIIPVTDSTRLPDHVSMSVSPRFIQWPPGKGSLVICKILHLSTRELGTRL